MVEADLFLINQFYPYDEFDERHTIVPNLKILTESTHPTSRKRTFIKNIKASNFSTFLEQ